MRCARRNPRTSLRNTTATATATNGPKHQPERSLGSRSLTYDGANLPTRIEHNDNWNAGILGNRVNYAYGPDNARYLHTEDGGTSETFGRIVYYGADGYELEIGQTGEEQHRIELGPVVYTRRREGNTVDPSQVAYQLRDRLGSAISIADRWGHFNGTGTGQALPTAEGELRRFFDLYGAPRQVNFRKTDFQPELKYGKTTMRGFTGHEHLDEARLVHMNGRMFDYRTGRFLSVDPLLSSPYNGQAINPYSYILNNPLRGIDITGYAPDCENSSSCHLDGTEVTSLEKIDDTETGSSIVVARGSDGYFYEVKAIFVPAGESADQNGAEVSKDEVYNSEKSGAESIGALNATYNFFRKT